MKESHKKVMIVAIIAIIIFGLTYAFYVREHYVGFAGYEDAGLTFLYDVQNAGFYLPFFIFVSYVAAVISIKYHKEDRNNFSYQVISRVGYKKYFFEKIKKVALTSAIFRLLCHLLLILITYLFFIRINFVLQGYEVTDPELYIFSGSTLLTLIIYIIYSTIGYVIYSLFIYSLSYFIKKTYVYRVLGIIFAILLYILSALLMSFLMPTIGEEASRVISYFFFTGSLLTPGLDILGPSINLLSIHVLTLITFVGFIAMTVLLLYRRYKKESKNE